MTTIFIKLTPDPRPLRSESTSSDPFRYSGCGSILVYPLWKEHHMTPRIESLLSARLFLAPQLWDNRIYFVSNLSGHLSLYAMDYGGSVPEPLLPPNIALQNPELLDASSFHVIPELGKILVAIDNNGDEK